MNYGDKILNNFHEDDYPDDSSAVMFIKHANVRIEVTCGCKHFEEVGWLCQHYLRVLDNNGINKIPEQYIKKRWTKTLKEKVW